MVNENVQINVRLRYKLQIQNLKIKKMSKAFDVKLGQIKQRETYAFFLFANVNCKPEFKPVFG